MPNVVGMTGQLSASAGGGRGNPSGAKSTMHITSTLYTRSVLNMVMVNDRVGGLRLQ